MTGDAQFTCGEGEILTQTCFMSKPLCLTLAFFFLPGSLLMVLKTVQRDLPYLGFLRAKFCPLPRSPLSPLPLSGCLVCGCRSEGLMQKLVV